MDKSLTSHDHSVSKVFFVYFQNFLYTLYTLKKYLLYTYGTRCTEN